MRNGKRRAKLLLDRPGPRTSLPFRSTEVRRHAGLLRSTLRKLAEIPGIRSASDPVAHGLFEVISDKEKVDEEKKAKDFDDEHENQFQSFAENRSV